MQVLIRIHEAYRKIVAVCDPELLGKKFEEGNLQLEINERFYNGKKIDEKSAIKILKKAQAEDACFNFVGEKSIKIAIKAGIIDKECVLRIQGIPHALALL
ncbi:MAG: DUF424 family protein [Candidatus Pacearchaeota archaeon]|nr:DUF424 family protein [Candidatus Pacearchaeota archaeon]